MDRVLIDFVDFPNLEKADNPVLSLLKRRYELVLSDWPDFILFTHEGQRHKLYPCTKIFYTHEAYGPNWKHCDYAILSIKVNDPRAFHLPYYSLWRSPADLIRPAGADYRAMLKAKSGFCSFLTWYNDRTVRHRSEFFKKLHARKPVDSAGRALNNTGWRVPLGREPKLEFLRRYKFNICFENKDVPGWTTEKFTDALASSTVPIFWGDITVKEQFNQEAFIDRRDFASDEACIEHILKVDANDELYLKYLSAPPFYHNRPNKEWDHERLLDFFDQIFNSPPDPVAQRRWFSNLTKWRLVKRVKTHTQKGMPTPEERLRERQTAKHPPAAAAFDIKPRRWVYLLLAYLTLHVTIRTLLSSSADGDEAEQVMLAQQALWGYGSQPPLYTWLQIGFFTIFGLSVFSLALLKNLLLAGTYLLTYWNAKLVTRSRACGLAAALSLLFIVQIAYESQRDLTHSVLAATLAAATLLIFLRTHQSKRLVWYISLGFCLGLGCLSKYNYLLWPLAMTVAALSIPELRRTVLDKRMLVAVAICVLMFLPNGVWILHHRAQAFSSAAKFNVQDVGSLLAAFGVALGHLITAVLKFLGPLVLVYWGVFWKARCRSGEALTLADDSAPAVYRLFLKRSLLVVGVMLVMLVLGFRTAGIRDRWLQPVLIFAPVLAAAVVRERLDAVRLKRLVAASGVVMVVVTVGLPGRIILAEKLNRKEFLTHPYRQIAQQLAEAIPESSRVQTPTRLMAGNLRLHMPGRLFVSFGDNVLFADNQEHCFIAWDTEGSEQTPYLVRLWLQGHGPGSGLPAGAVRYFTAPYQYHHHRQMRVALMQIR